jgi:hypothetical protein
MRALLKVCLLLVTLGLASLARARTADERLLAIRLTARNVKSAKGLPGAMDALRTPAVDSMSRRGVPRVMSTRRSSGRAGVTGELGIRRGIDAIE